MTYLQNQYDLIRKKLNKEACLIAVSKFQSVENIEELYHLGHRDFGENYVQELIQKAKELENRGCSEIRWHFIGHLQTNKVKTLLPFVGCIQTLDSVKLAQEISKRWKEQGRSQKLSVFVQINIDREPDKSGIFPEESIEIVKEISKYSELHVEGLMCIPAQDEDPRPRFIALRELELACRPYTHGKLSMGMSSDFEIALEEGSTHIRVGTALFGDRKHHFLK